MSSSIGQRLISRLGRLPKILRHQQNPFTRWSLVAIAGVIIASMIFVPFSSTSIASAAAGCTQGTTLNIVAHEDDDLLFLSPNLLHNIQTGRCVRTVYVTAGDAGNDATYWQGRESGVEAAYAEMNGVTNSWTQSDAGVSGHPIPIFTLSGKPNISLAFMRLPDGNADGSGFSRYNFESLQKLWTGTISNIHADDSSSSYSKATLESTLTALMTSFQPDQVNTQDYVGSYGDSDHSDHHTVAYLTRAAQQQYTTPHTLTGYQDYSTSALDANVTGADLTAKQNAFYTYGQFDPIACSSTATCANTGYELWLQRQYTVCPGSSGNQPVANAGVNQTVVVKSTVQLDGTCSSDPNGNPLTYQWTQTGGPGVTLSDSTTVQPTFTAPASVTSLTFQLVVNNGHTNSSPSTVTITVTASSGQPPVANAGANQTVVVNSPVQLDGSGSMDPDGYPLTYQWTQTGGPGVTLSSSTAMLPTFTAPASVTTLTFQLVVNDGQANSSPSTVTITVTDDLALSATATASSQNTSTGQTANKAIDGVIDGYPGNYTKEWATAGGGAGSWLKLTWASPQTVNKIVLYDRPNLNDQITGGNIQFSDGSSVPVGSLNNDGSAVTIIFANKTITSLQLNITSVSASTGNVGLAEIQVYNSSTPFANAGANQTVAVNTTVQLDGSGSLDPDGDPLTYQWTQTGGPGVTLSSSTTVQPTFTAPASATSLTFQLVVNDGHTNSSPATTVTITVTDDLAFFATATASSQNTNAGQTADKAIDGVIDGYPGNYTKEWATAGGGAGSWLKLTWASPQTVNKIVLYDRPNLSDQVTGGNIQFSDGSSVPVGPLNNDGSATTITFANKTITSLQLNITSVSASTGNVGLAEIQVYHSAGGGTQPVANAGANQTVAVNSTVQLDGSGSSDPGGNPLTYQWTQTGGPGVTLSSSTAVQPTFTAPASVTTLTFQLVVNDGQANSSPSTVTITVSNSSDLALSATATASSQNTSTGQTADKAIDGVIDGYPGDYTKEWATAGGGAGSWLKLTWASPQTVGRIVLYDRPNLSDQITGATIQFSDGSSVTVGPLNNDGSATTITFPAKTITSLQLNITSVSASSQNVGLAEIQVYAS